MQEFYVTCPKCEFRCTCDERWTFCPRCGVALAVIVQELRPLGRSSHTSRPVREKLAYTVAEAAELTGYSRSTITRMFENEKGVLSLERPEKMHKRSYRSIRIPRDVFSRVMRKFSN